MVLLVSNSSWNQIVDNPVRSWHFHYTFIKNLPLKVTCNNVSKIERVALKDLRCNCDIVILFVYKGVDLFILIVYDVFLNHQLQWTATLMMVSNVVCCWIFIQRSGQNTGITHSHVLNSFHFFNFLPNITIDLFENFFVTSILTKSYCPFLFY